MQYDIIIQAVELDHQRYAVVVYDAMSGQLLLKSPPLDSGQCARVLDYAFRSAKQKGYRPQVQVCECLAGEARSAIAVLN